jgi:hypothetical protein
MITEVRNDAHNQYPHERAFLDSVIGSLPVAKNLIRAIEAALKDKNHE